GGGGPRGAPEGWGGARGRREKLWGQGGRAGRPRLEQDDAGAARIDPPKVLGQGLARDLGDGSGHFDAGRSPTDDDESEQTLPLGIVVGELGLLERQQNASANAGRV